MLKGLTGATVVGASAGALPLFGTPSRTQTPASCPGEDLSETERELHVSTWPRYIDPVDFPDSTLRRFEQRSGIRVRYVEDITDPDLCFAKLRNQLGTCQPTGRDLFVVNGHVTGRMIRMGWLQPLDHARLPNMTANLLPTLRMAAFDPGRRHSVPWQTGYTSICYNAARVPPVRSFEELISRRDLRGRVTLLLEMHDTMAFMLRISGANLLSVSDEDWRRALERLKRVRAAGHVRAFRGAEYVQELASGNTVAALGWSGDIVQLQREMSEIRFVVPEEGMQLWSDNMQIPNRARHYDAAHRWIDHYYDPEVAARVAAYVCYVCPVRGAREIAARTDPQLADNPLVFPDEDYLSRTWEMAPLEEHRRRRYLRDFAEAIGG